MKLWKVLINWNKVTFEILIETKYYYEVEAKVQRKHPGAIIVSIIEDKSSSLFL